MVYNLTYTSDPVKCHLCAVLPAEAWFPRGAGGLAAGQAEAGVPAGEAGHLPHLLLPPALPLHQLGDRGAPQPHPGQHCT